MPTSIDSLQIQINASATKANDAIDKLVYKLDGLSASLTRIKPQEINNLAVGVEKLGTAMQTVSNINTSGFTKIASNITKLSVASQSIGLVDTFKFSIMANAMNKLGASAQQISGINTSGVTKLANSLAKFSAVDVSGLRRTANEMPKLVSAFNSMGNLSDNAKQIGVLAGSLTKLGYKTATQAITNIPLLAKAIRELMVELSKAPKVSRNIIDMTNALARLSRTGANSGRSMSTLSRGLNSYSSSATTAHKRTKSLASAFGKMYASYWLLFRGIRKIGEAMTIASDLTEVQNVVDVTFGKYASMVEDMSKTSIEDFGMNELTVKQVSSRFQAMGSAMGIAQDRMADMSIELTKLTADMASFYNMEQKDVAEDLESVFTGQTRPMRTYGVDLTQATLKEWALKQGIDANIESMSQMEKTMLRYQYVMAHTTQAQGDFVRTADTWANQVRILKQNFEQLAIIIGKVFINTLKPVVKAINGFMSSILNFATTVYNALGKIFGWKFEVSGGGVANDLEEGGVGAGEIEDGLGGAVQNAKELNKQLGKFDELNVINTNTKSDGSGGGSGTGGGAGAITDPGNWVKGDGILEEFKSEIDSLYELGEYINQVLTDTLKGIDWESIYENARGFGKGLADFFNGLISPELFGEVGKTIANSLNTAIYASLSFAETFDFEEFGESLANGVNNFFTNFDFVALGQSINTWCNGIIKAIKAFFENLSFSDVFSGLANMLKEFDLSTITVIVGAFTFKHMKSVLTKGILASVLTKKLGMGSAGMSMSFPLKIMLSAISVAATFDFGTRFGEEIGKLIYGDNEYYHLNPAELMKELYNTFATGEGDNPFEKISRLFNKRYSWNDVYIVTITEIPLTISTLIFFILLII